MDVSSEKEKPEEHPAPPPRAASSTYRSLVQELTQDRSLQNWNGHGPRILW